MYSPTIKSYFSGAGGFDIGLMEGGCDVIQALELDNDCVETQRLNFFHDVLHCDITSKTVLDQIKSDVMVAGYPCKKYSAIADIHGARTGGH